MTELEYATAARDAMKVALRDAVEIIERIEPSNEQLPTFRLMLEDPKTD